MQRAVNRIPQYRPNAQQRQNWDFDMLSDSVGGDGNAAVNIYYDDDFALAYCNGRYRLMLARTEENWRLRDMLETPDRNHSRFHFHPLQSLGGSDTVMMMTNTTDHPDTIHPIDPYEYCTLPAAFFETRYRFDMVQMVHNRFESDFTITLERMLHASNTTDAFSLHMYITDLCLHIAKTLAECPLRANQWLRIDIIKTLLRISKGLEREFVMHEAPPVEITFADCQASYELITYILRDNLYESLAMTMALRNISLYASENGCVRPNEHTRPSFFERLLQSQRYPNSTHRKTLILRRHTDASQHITVQASLDIVFILYPNGSPPPPLQLLRRAEQDQTRVARLIPEMAEFEKSTPLGSHFLRVG